MNTTRILRHINAIRCLRLLHDGRSMSRADIARELGLTRATIGNAITVLANAGYILEGEMIALEGRGRPGVAVSINASGAYFVGLDIGPSVLTAVVVDLRMNVVSRIVEPTGPQFRDPEKIFERMLVLVRRVISEAGAPLAKIEGLCVSIPGLVARDGMVINAPFLEWRDFPLRDRLVDRCEKGWIVSVCNDSFAFANAEASGPMAPNAGSVLLVLMAEGVGGAIIDAGKPFSGAHGYAGELGHMVITVGGRTDTFEMFAGSKAFAHLLDADATVTEGVADLLSAPDRPEVATALDRWAEAVATGLANVIHLLDPGRIVIGGSVADLFPSRAVMVEDKLRDKLLSGFVPPHISIARHRADGAAIGAAATIRKELFSLPELD